VAQQPYSKRDVSRAGQALAARLEEQRHGKRASLIEPGDVEGEEARDVVEWWLAQHVEPMLEVYDVVQRIAPELNLGDSRVTAVSFRPKRFDSTIEKLTREPGKLADMADLGGVRAVVDTQDDADDLHARLESHLEIRRVRDWARRPRPTGYRAVHLHIRQRNRMVEVQLRTFGQDAWANAVEAESRLSGLNYKAGQGHPAVLDLFRAIADFFAAIELGESHPDLVARFATAYRHAKPLLRSPKIRDVGP
jgi:putative GTP pyrophosphokinase